MARKKKTDSDPVLRVSQAYFKEADGARKDRMRMNSRNRDVYMGDQDWSHKQDGQSTEFLPKTSMATEQFSAFVKRALVQFGDWFSVTASQGPLNNDQIVNLLQCFFKRLPNGPRTTTLPVIIADVVKAAMMDSLLIAKVHGQQVAERRFRVEPGIPLMDIPPELSPQEFSPWRLRIDGIRAEDYYPDPTGRGLYEIHRSECDLHEVLAEAQAEDSIYDLKAVEALVDTARKEEEERPERQRGQRETDHPGFRKRVVKDEYWGTILDEDGRVLHRNVVWTVANETHVIRKPEPNPFWHGESPFVVAPLLRVPDSVWHKALIDDAASLNVALNEMFNLMVDGGMASVWGIKQIHQDWLEDPDQVSGGIPQGTTLALNDNAPPGAKVLETVTEGRVPPDAIQMLRLLDVEFQSSMFVNDIKLGHLPPKQVRATEIVEASASQSVTLDSLSADIEQEFLSPLIRKSWLTILQNADNLSSEDIVAAIGMRGALLIARMSPAERFAMWAGQCEFRVSGLSSTLARVRDFQKLGALLQMVGANPLLLQAFFQKYSGTKVLEYAMRLLNFDPTNMEKDENEQANADNDLRQLGQFAQLAGGRASVDGPGTGGEELPAEINQIANPITGMGQT